MFKVGDFKIGTDSRWFYITDAAGNVIRRFDLNKYEIEEVRMWREGYVKGLNAAQI